MAPKRILVLSESCLPWCQTNLALRLHSISTALKMRGHDVFIVTQPNALQHWLGRPPSLPELRSELDGIEISHLVGPDQMSSEQLQSIYVRMLDVFVPDLVLAACQTVHLEALQAVTPRASCPVMLYSDGTLRPTADRLRSRHINRAWHTFFHSARHLEELSENALATSRLSVIEDSVPPTTFMPRPGTPGKKRFVVAQPELLGTAASAFIDVLNSMAARGCEPNVILLDDVANPHPSRRAILTQCLNSAAQAGLSHQVSVRKTSSFRDLRNMFRSCDVALFLENPETSKAERNDLLVALALSCGAVPVLSAGPHSERLRSRLGTLPFIAPRLAESGGATSRNDPLVQRLSELCTDLPRVRYSELQGMDWTAMCAPIEDALNDLDLAKQIAISEGVEGLDRRYGLEAETSGAQLTDLLRTVAQHVFPPESPGLAAAIYNRIAELDPSTRNCRTAFYEARRANAFDLVLENVRRLKMLRRVGGPAWDALTERAWQAAEVQFEGILQLKDRLQSALRQPKRATPGKRVAYWLHQSLPFSSVGYATRSHGLSEALTHQGMDLVCLTRPGFPRDIIADLDEVPKDSLVGSIRYHHVAEPQRGNDITYMIEAVDAMKAEIVRVGADVVMSASNHMTALPALIAARELGLPFVYEVRGFWEITRLSREPTFEHTLQFQQHVHLEKMAVSNADHLFTLTSSMRDELARRGASVDKITLLPNSADPDVFAPIPRDDALAARLGLPDDVPVIGYVGSFVQYEGLDQLMAAAVRLRQMGHVFRMLIVGSEGPHELGRTQITDALLRDAEINGMRDWLIMPGRVDFADVQKLYSLIDIAPFPRKPQTVTELVSPLKPLEAMAMGKAVAVSSVGPLQELVEDGVRGRVFRKGDVEDMARVLGEMLADPASGRRMGAVAREWVRENRTWSRLAKTAITSLAPLQQTPGTPGEKGHEDRDLTADQAGTNR